MVEGARKDGGSCAGCCLQQVERCGAGELSSRPNQAATRAWHEGKGGGVLITWGPPQPMQV